MTDLRVGFALTGSFCTFKQVLPVIKSIKEQGAIITPIMSQNAYSTDTRFGTAEFFKNSIEEICQNKIIHTIKDAEPIGPKELLDILIIAPCTGNTLGKLASGITDTSVTMAAKAHLRNLRPLVIAVSTNDALYTSAKSIGLLLAQKNIYFVPMRQDSPLKKTNSIVADFDKIIETAAAAKNGAQIEPLLI